MQNCELMEQYADMLGVPVAGSGAIDRDHLRIKAENGDCQFSHLCPERRKCQFGAQHFAISASKFMMTRVSETQPKTAPRKYKKRKAKEES